MSALQATIETRKLRIAGNTDTSLLKIIALVSMIIDHVGVAFFPGVLELRIFGRIAMPLYAWSLVVGCEYTHSMLKYAMRLFVLGILSQPLYIMVLGATWTNLNILFLLGLGVLAIAGIQRKRYFSQFWVPALCFVLLFFVDIDYGWRGLLFILFLYVSRTSKASLAGAFIASAIIWGMASFSVTSAFGVEFTFLSGNIFSPLLDMFFQMQTLMWLALPLILIRTHTHIRMPKWLGYGLYPIHLFVLLLIGLLTGIPLAWYISTLSLL